MSLTRWLCFFALGGCLVLALAACDTASMVGGSGGGQMDVYVHDQAAPEIEHAWVTFSRLQVRRVGGTWNDVAGTFPVRLDLLELVGGLTALLASGNLDPGQYDAMRVTITEAQVVLVGDPDPVDVPLPAGGLTVEVTGFPVITVDESGTVTITLDFPVNQSFIVNGTTVQFDPYIIFESAQ